MVRSKIIKAILSENGEKNDVRCGNCGKKLLEFEKKIQKNSKKVLTNTKKSDNIINVKCTRCAFTNSFLI